MLTTIQRRWIAAVLANDENASDKEMLAYFVENGLSQAQAEEAVSQRNAYIGRIEAPELYTEAK
jgi:hypothetical protein